MKVLKKNQKPLKNYFRFVLQAHKNKWSILFKSNLLQNGTSLKIPKVKITSLESEGKA